MKADKNVFSLVRKFFIEYKAEFVFGLVLLACVAVSIALDPLIPNDIFYQIISPIQTIAIITVSLVSTWAMWRHSAGIRVRYVYAWIMGTMSVVMTAGVAYRMLVNAELQPAEGIFSFEGWEMLGADLIAWLLLAYPSELLRPGWLTIKNALKRILPVVVIGVIDIFTPLDLRWLLALVPVVWVALLFVHVYQYRKYCEENYSSTEQTDEEWVIRYLVMILVLGVSYIYISFSEDPTRLFTEQWLMFFVLVYTSDQVIFRSKPWIEDAVLETGNVEVEELSSAEMSASNIASNAEYRRALEEWMASEKPYLNPDFRLTDLMHVLPMNRTYLSNFINGEYGCNFYQYVTNYRIEEAKRLMREHPDMKLMDVAEQSGFASAVTFSRTFAKETGYSPTEWTKTLNNS